MFTSNFPYRYTVSKSESERWRIQARSPDFTRAVRQRIEWMIHAKAGGNVRATCRHFGIAPKVFYFWRKRFNERDFGTLENVSSRPQRVRKTQRTSEEETRMVNLRRAHIRESAKKLAVRYRKLYPEERLRSAYQFECVIKKQ